MFCGGQCNADVKLGPPLSKWWPDNPSTGLCANSALCHHECSGIPAFFPSHSPPGPLRRAMPADARSHGAGWGRCGRTRLEAIHLPARQRLGVRRHGHDWVDRVRRPRAAAKPREDRRGTVCGRRGALHARGPAPGAPEVTHCEAHKGSPASSCFCRSSASSVAIICRVGSSVTLRRRLR